MAEKICRNCGKDIPKGTQLGSGKKSEGVFCDLTCYAEYYRAKLIERAKKVAAGAARHRDS